MNKLICIKPNGKMYQTKWKNVSNQMEKCIKPNGKMYQTK